jgi:hypothetical protein
MTGFDTVVNVTIVMAAALVEGIVAHRLGLRHEGRNQKIWYGR